MSQGEGSVTHSPTAAPPLCRRSFLQTSAAAALSFVRSAAAEAAEADASIAGLFDAHTHFYDPTRPHGVPWPGKDDKLLYRRVLPADLKAVSRRHHVTGTVVVEASPWVEDNQWLLDLAEKDSFILGVVGRLTPGAADWQSNLRRFARNPMFRGIRINNDELRRGLGHRAFVKDLEGLAALDLALDVNGGPDMPAQVARLASRIPDLRIVINHAANVPIDGKAVRPDWLAGMKAASQGSRIYCKVSALVEATGSANGKAPRETTFYKPVLDALWQVFGEDRLLFASNWPVSERFASYDTVVRVVRGYFDARGQAAAAKFFSRNAVAAYKLKLRQR